MKTTLKNIILDDILPVISDELFKQGQPIRTWIDGVANEKLCLKNILEDGWIAGINIPTKWGELDHQRVLRIRCDAVDLFQCIEDINIGQFEELISSEDAGPALLTDTVVDGASMENSLTVL